MKNVNFDSDGLIVLKDGDGGDCGAESGRYYAGLKFREILGIDNSEWPRNGVADFDNVVNHLVTWKQVLRYNKPPYHALSDVSRDQHQPMLVALYLYGKMAHLKGITDELERSCLFPNGDIYGPVDWSLTERFMEEKPFTIPGDIQQLGSVAVRCLTRDMNNVGNDLNLTVQLCLSLHVKPTLWSQVSRLVYRQFRKGGIQRCWDHYYRPETGNNPLNELWQPVISHFLG